ncbi:MAG: DUF192 domain-containing protein [Gammaproteobacteria bacterium]
MRHEPSSGGFARATGFLRARVAWFLAAALCLGAGGFAPYVIALAGAAGTPAFNVADIEIRTRDKTIPLAVEIAATADQRATGLMGRARLAPNAGMLFLYPGSQPPESGFWMYRTRIPLDIAFLETNGRIVAIDTMAPCASANPSRCPPYLAGVEYSGALEVNKGFYARHDVEVGDRVTWSDAQAHTQ